MKPNQRAAALKAHIENLSPNLIRAYVLDMIEDAPPEFVEKMIVAFGAQNAVQGENMIRGKSFATFGDSLVPPPRKPIPEGAFVVVEWRDKPKATWWDRFSGKGQQMRWVPLRLGADGYLYGDFDAATDWT